MFTRNSQRAQRKLQSNIHTNFLDNFSIVCLRQVSNISRKQASEEGSDSLYVL